MGSVTPLLALAEELKSRGEHEFLWLGTKTGPERALIAEWNIPLKPIFAGKLRRYFSLYNFLDPLKIFAGFCQALWILKKFKPDTIVAAGGFVAVPVVLAGAILKIPILVHQQDLEWGLANKIMRLFACWITINFEPTLKTLPRRFRRKARLVGNPVRFQIRELSASARDHSLLFQKFYLEPDLPVVLALGGGTGALRLNEIITEAMPYLYHFCQVLHLTGKEKKVKVPEGEWGARYHWQEFLTKEMTDTYNVADLVVTRAGIGTLSELAILGKPAIIVPMPKSHQEDNARYFSENKAAIVVDQEELTPYLLSEKIRELLLNSGEREILSANIKKFANPEAAQDISDLILKI